MSPLGRMRNKSSQVRYCNLTTSFVFKCLSYSTVETESVSKKGASTFTSRLAGDKIEIKPTRTALAGKITHPNNLLNVARCHNGKRNCRLNNKSNFDPFLIQIRKAPVNFSYSIMDQPFVLKKLQKVNDGHLEATEKASRENCS